jgi:hypothetical protein
MASFNFTMLGTKQTTLQGVFQIRSSDPCQMCRHEAKPFKTTHI